MKNIGNILVVSVLLFASLVLLIDRSYARSGLCFRCKVTLPNVANIGGVCFFVHSDATGRNARYEGTYLNSVGFKQCDRDALWRFCLGRTKTKYATCLGWTTQSGFPNPARNRNPFTLRDACE